MKKYFRFTSDGEIELLSEAEHFNKYKEKDADLKEFSAMSDSKQIAVLDLRMLSKIW